MSNVPPPTAPPRPFLLTPLALLAILNSGAMFGFFYAWICSTMWGLDAADFNVAISAMQAVNASVRNPVFAVGYFGTPLVLAVGYFGTPLVLAAVALVAWRGEERHAAILFGMGSLLYVMGVMVPTSMVNVPLNEALAAVEAPLDGVRAQEVWQSYSVPWQSWNTIRTVVAGAALLLVGVGILRLGRSGSSGLRRGSILPSSPDFP